MRNLLKCLVVACIAMVAIAGCGDDPVDPGNGNQGGQLTFKQNDQFTYNYYTRDASNQRDESTKQVKVWTIIDVNQTVGGRNGVTVIAEQTFQADGVTPTAERDTFYIQTASDGRIYQYNLLRSVVKRIPGAAAFIDSVPPAWIQIGNTGATTATTWSATGDGPVTAEVSIIGIATNISLTMNAMHKGTQSVTVPKGTITNSVHTDHDVIVAASTQFGGSSDTLRVAYDISSTEGIARQTLGTRTITLLSLNQMVPGFDMELVSAVRAQ